MTVVKRSQQRKIQYVNSIEQQAKAQAEAEARGQNHRVRL